jgi:hypothetical protein
LAVRRANVTSKQGEIPAAELDFIDAPKSVKRCGELGVPVPDQELEAVRLTFQVHQQVPGLLGYPLACWVSSDARQVHAPGAMLDEEQHVQAAQEHGVDVEEVRGEDRRGLGGQERLPGLSGPSGCGGRCRRRGGSATPSTV